ncbi:SIMPL domain-containing protein [Bacillus norwichensis]|uniref:SIMPL domain-containing protein n=1 Tax=Bacillus norwichensis TaxID=2762217 RepID=A0ABR8VK11_9BACI|nr:SIMPL domain-containing protein [Bacillus norwichensis]MBD8005112.1 SIMPL domain-containing protein [Bacillus norwichensis]
MSFILIINETEESGEILMYYPLPYKTAKTRPYVIKVSGEGKISVDPDMAVIRLGVSTESLTLTKAQEENARTILGIETAFSKQEYLKMRSRLTIIPSIHNMIMSTDNSFSETIKSTICF